MRAFLLILVLGSVGICQTPSEAEVAQWGRWISDLGADAFHVREGAQKGLIAAGAEHTDKVLDLGAQAWPRQTDPEIQIRLRQVMETVVRDHVYGKPGGYLGVFMMAKRSLVDRSTVTVIHVADLVEGGPAERSNKIRSGDAILAVEGRRFPKDYKTSTFRNFLKTKRPGYALNLTLLREGRTREVTIKLGTNPKEAAKPPTENFREFFRPWWRTNVLDAEEPAERPD